MSIAALFTIAKTQNQPKCPLREEWTKEWIHVWNGILLNHRKNWIMPSSETWLDLEIITLNGVSQKEIIYMWNLKYNTNEHIYKRNRLTDTEKRLGIVRFRGAMEWEFGVSRCKLLCIEWIKIKVLLYSTESYIQCLVIKHNGQYMKNIIYIHTCIAWISLPHSAN